MQRPSTHSAPGWQHAWRSPQRMAPGWHGSRQSSPCTHSMPAAQQFPAQLVAPTGAADADDALHLAGGAQHVPPHTNSGLQTQFSLTVQGWKQSIHGGQHFPRPQHVYSTRHEPGVALHGVGQSWYAWRGARPARAARGTPRIAAASPRPSSRSDCRRETGAAIGRARSGRARRSRPAAPHVRHDTTRSRDESGPARRSAWGRAVRGISPPTSRGAHHVCHDRSRHDAGAGVQRAEREADAVGRGPRPAAVGGALLDHDGARRRPPARDAADRRCGRTARCTSARAATSRRRATSRATRA